MITISKKSENIYCKLFNRSLFGIWNCLKIERLKKLWKFKLLFNKKLAKTWIKKWTKSSKIKYNMGLYWRVYGICHITNGLENYLD